MKTSTFSATHLLKHQEQHGFHSHHVSTSAQLLADYRAQYAQKRALYDALFESINAGEVTIRTQHRQVCLMADAPLMEKIIHAAVEELEKDLARLERWVLEQAANVERGANECGIDVSPEEWAAAALLTPTAQAA